MLSKMFMPQDDNLGPSLDQRAQSLGRVPLNLSSPYKEATQTTQASAAQPPAPKPTTLPMQSPTLPQVNIQMAQPPKPTPSPVAEVAKPSAPSGRVKEKQEELPAEVVEAVKAKPSQPPIKTDWQSSFTGPNYASQTVQGISAAGGNFSLNSRPVAEECGPGFKKGYDGRCYPIFGSGG